MVDQQGAVLPGVISRETIQALPTIQRSISDFARTSPFVNATSFGNSATGGVGLSIAGRNNRYNNMRIDGAVNNDLFGLAATGTPGGQTGTQPISLDALSEIQIVVAPYDVRQGGFSGGGINAVTRSGSDTLSGTAYLFGQNQSLIGQIPGCRRRRTRIRRTPRSGRSPRSRAASAPAGRS